MSCRRRGVLQDLSMIDAAAPIGIRSYWKSTFLRELSDEAIDTFVRCAATCPSPRTWGRSACGAWSTRLVYVNALADHDGAGVHGAYGDNYARLARVKAKYDPTNLFRRNQNISPLADD